MLGNVFHAMAATVDKMSRGRRELARRFVPIENAHSLMKSKPTHSRIFGGASTEAAVDVAVKAAKTNKDLVYRPKAAKKPFQRAGPYGRGFQRYPEYQSQRYNPYSYSQYGQFPSRGSYPNSHQWGPQYQRGGYYPAQAQKKGHQRGKGRGKKRQTGASRQRY